MAIEFLIPFIFQIWSVVLSWLNPPYLYIIINCIIIAIAALSRFHKITSSPSPEFESFPVHSEITAVSEPPPLVYEGDDKIVEVKPVLLNGKKVEEQETDADADADIDIEPEDEEDISISTYTPPQKRIPPEFRPDFLLPATLGHWKPLRANRKGLRTPRVTRPKRRQTLESTWKMITDGRNVQPTKHLEKSDTWEHRGHHRAMNSPYHMSKSKTFEDGTNSESQLEAPTNLSLSTRISKQLSPGQEELNRRAEAFIKKVNEEMRLQRQESLDNYMEMINRGT
ncbi:unnamed protein product [Fraxinus pennsylvanica]|uniref:DUF4408 domain-containing protein n=1 Tax=Fraxinus pennsylvanica TaxID=56036 RepID=A0AAD2E0S1_9LAMI|nr:unnamed protein product [Fraxinus pennsylvanica]